MSPPIQYKRCNSPFSSDDGDCILVHVLSHLSNQIVVTNVPKTANNNPNKVAKGISPVDISWSSPPHVGEQDSSSVMGVLGFKAMDNL